MEPEMTKLMTASERLAAVKADALRDVESHACGLVRYLKEAQDSAEKALAAMAEGNQVFGAWAFGPLGHQLPFDLAATNEKLQGAMRTAVVAGATQDEVAAAYAAGQTRGA